MVVWLAQPVGLFFSLSLCLWDSVSSNDAASLKIGFGSCHNQKLPYQPMWQIWQDEELDLLLMLGDNVYADKPGPYRGRMPATRAEMYKAYETLFNHSGFNMLR
jgi:phosphodiesterase/alkaline phosphatase D-like protein